MNKSEKILFLVGFIVVEGSWIFLIWLFLAIRNLFT